MKKNIITLFLLLAVLLVGPFVARGISATTLIPPTISCDNWSSSNGAFALSLSLPPQYSAPGYEVRDLNNNLITSGAMGYQATAYIPANLAIHARVTDGNGNYSGWSTSTTCHHSSSGYAISVSCGSVVNNTRSISMSWSPGYMVQSTYVYSNNYLQVYGHHENGSEGISSPDIFTAIPASGPFIVRLYSFPNGVAYDETVTCH